MWPQLYSQAMRSSRAIVEQRRSTPPSPVGPALLLAASPVLECIPVSTQVCEHGCIRLPLLSSPLPSSFPPSYCTIVYLQPCIYHFPSLSLPFRLPFLTLSLSLSFPPSSHPVTHTCHCEEECPPCTFLTEKLCMGEHEVRPDLA